MISNLMNEPAFYRIGAVSKLSGIPVPTLRVWQTRYGAFSPITTRGQHRLYNEDDVRKALLLKLLTRQGHGISQIAGLATAQLQQLQHTGAGLTLAAEPAVALQAQPCSGWGVIGPALADRLQSAHVTMGLGGQPLPIEQIWSDLDHARRAPPDTAPEVLLVSVNGLNQDVAQQILGIAKQLAAHKTVVLYAFGQMGAVMLLRHSGHEVHQNPMNDNTLIDIVHSTRARPFVQSWGLDKLPTPIPARQFSEAVLQRVANIPSQVLCECPRHVAELIGQLGRFEDYSRDCLNQSPRDAQLHTQLNLMAATARALFEKALQMVASHEGISLQETL